MLTVVFADVVEIALNGGEVVCHLHKLNSARYGGMHAPSNAAHSVTGPGLEIPTEPNGASWTIHREDPATNIRREFAKPCQLHTHFPDARWRAFLRFPPKL